MDNEFGVRNYLEIAQRRWRVIIVVVAVSLVTAASLTRLVPPTYSASATIRADTAPPVILSDQAGQGSIFPAVALEAPPDAAALAEVAKSDTVQDGAIARLASLLPPERAKALVERMRITLIRNTQMVRLTAEHADPLVAAGAANAVAETLVDVTLRARRQRATQTREFIEAQLAQADQQLRVREEALTDAKHRYGSAALQEETTRLLQQLGQLTTQRTDLRSQRSELESRIAKIRATLAGQSLRSPTQWVPSPLIAQLRNQLVDLEIQRVAQSKVYTPQHRVMIELNARIEETKRRLQAELTKDLQPQQYGVDPSYQQLTMQLQDAEVTLAGGRAREWAIDRAIQEYEGKIQALPATEAEMARLTRDVRAAESTYLLLSGRLEEARIVEASIASGVRVVDVARVPERPARGPRTNIALGLLAGLMASVVAVAFVEHFDDSVRSVDDIQVGLGAPVLASIPFWQRPRRLQGKVELPLVPMDGQFPLADAFRLLRFRLQTIAHERTLRTLLISSPGPAEGKDFVAANLAIAFTQAGRRVWLVEGDLRRPGLSRVFGSSTRYGLTDLLRDGFPVDQALQPTTVNNLWLLPHGAQPPNPTELLGSQAMGRLLGQARRDNVDVVIINAPPVLPVADALVLAPQVDGVLLVVRVGKTPLDAARHARDRLQEVQARLLGVVVNGVPVDRRGGYYYGGRYSTEPDGQKDGKVATPSGGR